MTLPRFSLKINLPRIVSLARIFYKVLVRLSLINRASERNRVYCSGLRLCVRVYLQSESLEANNSREETFVLSLSRKRILSSGFVDFSKFKRLINERTVGKHNRLIFISAACSKILEKRIFSSAEDIFFVNNIASLIEVFGETPRCRKLPRGRSAEPKCDIYGIAEETER